MVIGAVHLENCSTMIGLPITKIENENANFLVFNSLFRV